MTNNKTKNVYTLTADLGTFGDHIRAVVVRWEQSGKDKGVLVELHDSEKYAGKGYSKLCAFGLAKATAIHKATVSAGTDSPFDRFVAWCAENNIASTGRKKAATKAVLESENKEMRGQLDEMRAMVAALLQAQQEGAASAIEAKPTPTPSVSNNASRAAGWKAA